MRDDDDIWLLAQIKLGGLSRAKSNLARQGFHAFMPQQRATVRRGGAMVDRTRPLFPGYLFVQAPSDCASWRPICSTLGISRLVTFDRERPVIVPKGLITALREACNAEGVFTPREAFSVGEKVRIVHGPFSDWLGKIMAAPEDGRAFVLLDLLGRRVPVTVPTASLQRSA